MTKKSLDRKKLRQAFLAFIKEVNELQDGTNDQDNPDGTYRRWLFRLAPTPDRDDKPSLMFGYGYFGKDNVTIGSPHEVKEVPPEEGVDLFMKAYDLDR